MELISVDKLIPHKQNNYFFDDMEGESWFAFTESIETSGVIEPVIVTTDMVIVSGHQRVRACKLLGIKKVLCDIRSYESEDEILKQLIETNIRQRGIGNTNPVKFGRCIAELERIYGIRQGSAGKVAKDLEAHNEPLNEDDLAEQLDISKAQLKRYKTLTDLIPELQDAVQTGQITATTAMGFVKKLNAEQQKQLVEMIGTDQVSSKDVNEYVRQLEEQNKQLRADNITLAKRSEPQVIEKEVVKEVVPEDYQKLKQDNAELRQRNKKLSESLDGADEYRKKCVDEVAAQLHQKEQELEAITTQPDAELRHNLHKNAIFFCSAVNEFLGNCGGLAYLGDYWEQLDVNERRMIEGALHRISNWADEMLNRTVTEVVNE